jgi:hypothetical protein
MPVPRKDATAGSVPHPCGLDFKISEFPSDFEFRISDLNSMGYMYGILSVLGWAWTLVVAVYLIVALRKHEKQP